jgi:transposase-like protein
VRSLTPDKRTKGGGRTPLTKEWKMPPREWSMAKAQFAVIFGERFIRAMAA